MKLTELTTINAANNCATLTLTLDELRGIVSTMRAYASDYETGSKDPLEPVERSALDKIEHAIELIVNEKAKLPGGPWPHTQSIDHVSTWSPETVQPSTGMTDDDLLDYLLTHSRTPFGQVSPSFMIRLFTLCGDFHMAQSLRESSRKWYYVNEDDIEPLVAMARAQRHLWTNEVAK